MSDVGDISTPEGLAKAVEVLSEEQLVARVTALGVDMVLDKVFDGMAQAFLPEKAGNQSADIQYDINTPDGVKTYHVQVVNRACTTASGPAAKPRVILRLSLVDFLRLITNHLNGAHAFMTGKLKLQGDMLFATTMETWFKKPGTRSV